MLTLENISLYRGGKPVLADCSLRINSGDRVGLVGANGAGKSSLMQLILGQLTPDGGHIALQIGVRVAHLEQEREAEESSALEVVIAGDQEVGRLRQAIAVAEAVERGLVRREAAGLPIADMGPVCTMMVGRLDDWVRVVGEKEGVAADPMVYDWAGVAAMKKAYVLYQERGYRLRLLSAAMRNRLHWSEFMGGDVVISPPYKWQDRFNASGVAVEERMSRPVDAAIIDELYTRFADFRRAYDEDGMTPAEFDTYGPTARTLRQFLKAGADLATVIREVMVPNPDL